MSEREQWIYDGENRLDYALAGDGIILRSKTLNAIAEIKRYVLYFMK